jgi:hypothetical protein
MSTSPFTKCRLGLAFALLVSGLVGGVLFARPDESSAACIDVLTTELDGFRYEYHVPTGRECLYDADRDPRGLVNLLPDHEDAAAKCRRELLAKLHVADLELLRARHADATRQLAALGYL